MALKTNIKDYIGDNAAEKKQQADDLVAKQWNTVNPSGTAVQNLQMPKLSMSDTGLSNWGEEQRAVQRAYDNAYGKNSQAATNPAATVAQALANGDIDLKGAQSSYGILAGQYADKAANMGPFNYDFNNDVVFKSLQNSYMREAKRAAAEAQAQAAARTGGYGNSYGAVAASQQYNNALQNLYDQIPELEQAAYNRWLNDKQDLYNQRDWYAGQGDKYHDRGYQEGRDAVSDAWREKEFDYNAGRDTIEDQWRQKEFDYGALQDQKGWDWKEREANREQGNLDRQFESAEDQRRFENNLTIYKQQMSNALQAAQLGNYSLIADMLDLDMSRAESADDLNMVLSLISSLGGIDKALPYIGKILGKDLGEVVNNYAGSGGSGGGSGRRSGGGSTGGGSTGGGTNDGNVNTDAANNPANVITQSLSKEEWRKIFG